MGTLIPRTSTFSHRYTILLSVLLLCSNLFGMIEHPEYRDCIDSEWCEKSFTLFLTVGSLPMSSIKHSILCVSQFY